MILFKNKETLSGILFLLLSAWLLYSIQQFTDAAEDILSIGPAFFPNILAIALAGLSIALTIQGLTKEKAPIISDKMRHASYVPALTLIGGVIVYMWLLPTLGFVLWNVLFLSGTQLIMEERNYKINAMYTVVVTVLVYVVFKVFLQVPLPGGLLGL